MREEFKKKVLETVDYTLANVGGNVLFMVIKPIVNLAKPELEKILEEKPEEVYNWLVIARDKINEAIKKYEDGK